MQGVIRFSLSKCLTCMAGRGPWHGQDARIAFQLWWCILQVKVSSQLRYDVRISDAMWDLKGWELRAAKMLDLESFKASKSRAATLGFLGITASCRIVRHYLFFHELCRQDSSDFSPTIPWDSWAVTGYRRRAELNRLA